MSAKGRCKSTWHLGWLSMFFRFCELAKAAFANFCEFIPNAFANEIFSMFFLRTAQLFFFVCVMKKFLLCEEVGVYLFYICCLYEFSANVAHCGPHGSTLGWHNIKWRFMLCYVL